MQIKKKILLLKTISKKFKTFTALSNINLEVYSGECVAIVGPSGCGKTTMLKIISGLESPDTGDVIFDNKVINDIPPAKRKINTVFQEYSLFPHMTVFDNIAFSLKIAGSDKRTIIT